MNKQIEIGQVISFFQISKELLVLSNNGCFIFCEILDILSSAKCL